MEGWRGAEHVKHAQTGMFNVFEGIHRVREGVVGHNPQGEGHRTRKNTPKRARSFVFGGVGGLKRRRTQKMYPFVRFLCLAQAELGR